MDSGGRYSQKRNLCRWKGNDKLERAAVNLILIAMRDGKELAWEEAAKCADPTASGEAFKQMFMKRKTEILDKGYALPDRCQGRKPRNITAENESSGIPTTPAKRSVIRNPFKTPVKRSLVQVNAPKRKRSRKSKADKSEYDSGNLAEPMSPMRLRERNAHVSYALDDQDNAVEPASDDESPTQIARARRSSPTYKVEDDSDDDEYTDAPSFPKRVPKTSTANAPLKVHDDNPPKSLLTLKLAHNKQLVRPPLATRDSFALPTPAGQYPFAPMPLISQPSIEHGLASVAGNSLGPSAFGIPSFPNTLLKDNTPAIDMQSFKSRNPFRPNNYDRLRGMDLPSGGLATILDWQSNMPAHMGTPGFPMMNNQVGGNLHTHGANANWYNAGQSINSFINGIPNNSNTFPNDNHVNVDQLPDPFIDSNEELVPDALPRLNTSFDFGIRPTGREEDSDDFEHISRHTSFSEIARIDSQPESEYVGWNQHLPDIDPNQQFLVDALPNNTHFNEFEEFVNMNDVAPQPMSDWS